MKNLIEVEHYHFPYTDLRFPGMNEGERILFVTRESEIMQKLHLAIVTTVALLLAGLGIFFISSLSVLIPQMNMFQLPLLLLSGLVFIVGIWWVTQTYKKSVFIITTRRLTKIIYTTPFTWYQFSLGLDEIEDTGSYSSSYLEAVFGLGYCVARSGAGAIKNFKIVNITYARDLHNYVNKLLYAFKHHPSRINEFRPFIPNVTAGKREELFRKYPEYKTEFD